MKNFLNIKIDGHKYMEGFLGLDWLASDESTRSAARYEDVVEYMLKCLWGKFTSYQVLTAIHRKAPKIVSIRPTGVPQVSSADKKLMQNYTTLQGLEKEKANKLIKQQVGTAQAIPKDFEQTQAKGSRLGHVTPQGHVEFVTAQENGRGSDVTIDFNPGVYADAGGLGFSATGFSSDEVLLHELIHAMSCVEGTQTINVPFQSPLSSYMEKSFDNLEEFTAIVITNVYRSECGRQGLRNSHDGDNRSELVGVSGQEFYNFYSKDMQQICTFHQMLAKELKRAVNIPFNPFVFCQV